MSKKNSILLVDFTNQIRARGVERHQAILEACPIRLRPILMTSTAMIARALPPALAIGPGAELQRPMAISLVGGIMVSTLLTLFVVPSAYSIIDDIVVWNEARRKRERASSRECSKSFRADRGPGRPTDQGPTGSRGGNRRDSVWTNGANSLNRGSS